MTIFEKIVAGKVPCEKVLENDDYLAFYDASPKASIHILVIPKVCVKDFQSASPEVLKGLCEFTKEVAATVGIDKTGYRVLTNIGEDSRQEVPHLHFHLLGGENLRGLGF